MDIFSILTDPKVLLLIAVIILLIALGIYTWRQSTYLSELKSKHEQQLKHGVILSEDYGKIRPELASNMSEETYHADTEGEDEDVEEETEVEEDDSGSASDDGNAHDDYIKELIKIQDHKRAPNDDYYIINQQQSGHNGPVYDSEEEELIFDNYEDDESESDGEDVSVNEEEVMAHAKAELKEAQVNRVVAKNETQVQEELIKRIENDIKRIDKSEGVIEKPRPLISFKPLAEKSKPLIIKK